MKKPAFFIAKPNVLGIFYVSSSVHIIFLTLRKYKKQCFFISEGLCLKESAWQVENMYIVLK